METNELARRRALLAWLLEIDEDARAALYDGPGWTDEDVLRELAELEELEEAMRAAAGKLGEEGEE